jgi:DNA-binding NarL/FixJ family response regulator
MTIRVLIADDEELLRGAFRFLIEAEPDLAVVGEAGDGGQAVALAAAEAPDVVLMDIRMPVIDGLEATRRITAARGAPGNAAPGDETGGPRVLILTTFDLDDYVFAALRNGASGFALKSRPVEELLDAIRVVASGEALLAPTVTRRLVAHYARQPKPASMPVSVLGGLTAREREVLLLIARGLSNAEIAGQLRMGVPTTKTHVSRILAKLGARDRAQLVIVAYETGLVGAGG